MGQYQLYHLFNRFSEIATRSAKEIGLWNEEMMINMVLLQSKHYI
ncbi:MAG: hypothetical protein ACLRHW_05430 [Coprobacillus cateniformis]